MTNDDNKPMTTGSWFLTLLLLSIPVVNFVLLIVWACGVGNRNRVTFCRASILLALIGVVFYLIFFVVLGLGAALCSPSGS